MTINNALNTTPATTPAQNDELLLLHKAEGIATLSLNQPKSINTLSEDMLLALQTHLDSFKDDRSIKAIVLRSSSKHFCAGHNLKEMSARRQDSDRGRAYFVELFQTCANVMRTITTLPQPVIAEVGGIATAAGCQLVAACDLAVAADTAKFATSGVNIGLFCSTPMVAVSRNVSRKHAMEMLLLGKFISAKRAAEMGLINFAVPEETLVHEVQEMAKAISNKSSAAIKIGKEAFYRQIEMPLDKAYEYAGWVMAENMMAQDAEAGIHAFINKDAMPEWIGQ